MKGPGLRIGLDVRREWRCPQCGRVVRLSGDVTAQACPCADPPVWMTLLPPVKREKPKFERIVIPEDPEPEPEPAAEVPTEASDSEPAVATEPEATAEGSTVEGATVEATPDAPAAEATAAVSERSATGEPPRREQNAGPREREGKRRRDRNRNRDRGPRPESPQSPPRERAIESVPPDTVPPSAGSAETAADEGFGDGIE